MSLPRLKGETLLGVNGKQSNREGTCADCKSKQKYTKIQTNKDTNKQGYKQTKIQTNKDTNNKDTDKQGKPKQETWAEAEYANFKTFVYRV